MQEIMERVTEVIRDVFDDPTIAVSETTTAADVDGWDSLMHVTLVVNIEKAFGMRFTSAEIAQLKNVGEIANLIQRQITRKKAG